MQTSTHHGPGRIRALLVALTLLVAACGSDPDSASSSSVAPTSSTPSTSTSSPNAQECDPSVIIELVGRTLTAARLMEVDVAWGDPGLSEVFAGRTSDPEDFAAGLGFDCHWSATQQFDDEERFALASWTGDRISIVLQTSDGPSEPYAQDRTVDILIDAPQGEMVTDDAWAVTGPDGETIILFTQNTSNLGLVAKSWFDSGDVVPGPGPDETATDRMAMPALQAAGGRNVGLAEASHGSPVSVYSLNSSLGDLLFVTVGPADQINPYALLPDGEVWDTEVAGLADVRFVDPSGSYPATAVGFVCDGFGWVIETDNGELAETQDFVARLITELDCDTGSDQPPPTLPDAEPAALFPLMTRFELATLLESADPVAEDFEVVTDFANEVLEMDSPTVLAVTDGTDSMGWRVEQDGFVVDIMTQILAWRADGTAVTFVTKASSAWDSEWFLSANVSEADRFWVLSVAFGPCSEIGEVSFGFATTEYIARAENGNVQMELTEEPIGSPRLTITCRTGSGLLTAIDARLVEPGEFTFQEP